MLGRPRWVERGHRVHVSRAPRPVKNGSGASERRRRCQTG
jgi:hypothetical protein